MRIVCHARLLVACVSERKRQSRHGHFLCSCVSSHLCHGAILVESYLNGVSPVLFGVCLPAYPNDAFNAPHQVLEKHGDRIVFKLAEVAWTCVQIKGEDLVNKAPCRPVSVLYGSDGTLVSTKAATSLKSSSEQAVMRQPTSSSSEPFCERRRPLKVVLWCCALQAAGLAQCREGLSSSLFRFVPLLPCASQVGSSRNQRGSSLLRQGFVRRAREEAGRAVRLVLRELGRQHRGKVGGLGIVRIEDLGRAHRLLRPRCAGYR